MKLAAYIVLTKDSKVLMSRRFNTGYGDGWLSLPAGHVDAGESISDAASRELLEEVGIRIPADELRLVAVVDRLRHPTKPYCDFFFLADVEGQVPENKEPTKCSELKWVGPGDDLSDALPHVRAIVNQVFARGGEDEKIEFVTVR